MVKRTMNNNKPKFILLFCILYVTQLTQCKVISRRDDDAGTNSDANTINLVGKIHSVPPKVALNKEDPGDAPGEAPVEAPGEAPVEAPGEAADDAPGEAPGDAPVEAPGAAQDPSTGPPIAALNKKDASDDEDEDGLSQDHKESQCWISLNEPKFFEKMNAVEQKYKDEKVALSRDVDITSFDKRMLDAMINTRGTAERTVQKFRGNPNIIPAGLNLGAYCMFRMADSILFMYRLKLRNDTHFTVQYLHNDLDQLTLTMRLSLHDLHLLGHYERALTSREDPSKLYYRPNKGEVEFLLKDVKYKVEGRYRVLDDRLHIEHIISHIPPMPLLMRFTDDPTGKFVPMSIDPNALRDYLDRMQNDLDMWLKDYFNDFLMLYGFEEAQKNVKIQQYGNERSLKLNEYADEVIDILNDRVRALGPSFMMPNFFLTAANGMEIKLYDGTIREADSMYRRSVATGKQDDQVRHLDADIGFSGLKAEYRYDVYIRNGLPPISGMFILNAEDISAHMALQVVSYKPSTADLHVTFMKYGKPETLTIEGPANRNVANFHHLLEHHIITIMSTALIHHIKSLSDLTKCDPQLPSKNDDSKVESGQNKITIDTDDNSDDEITTPMIPDNYDTTGPPIDPNDGENTEMPQSNEDDASTATPPDENETTMPSENEDESPTPPDNDDNEATTPSENDDETFPPDSDDNEITTPSVNDDETTPPDSDDNDINTPSENDDESPTPPDNDDNNEITTPSENDDESPTPPDNDDNEINTPSENDDEPTEPPDNDDEAPEVSSNRDDDDLPDNENNGDTDKANLRKPDFGFNRKESIELELPSKPGSKGESYYIDHKESFIMKKIITPPYYKQIGSKRLKGSTED